MLKCFDHLRNVKHAGCSFMGSRIVRSYDTTAEVFLGKRPLLQRLAGRFGRGHRSNDGD